MSLLEELAATHPAYDKRRPDWDILRDCYEGERIVKEATTKYLPATSGQHADGMGPGRLGNLKYRAYLARAVFPEILAPAVSALNGVMHRNTSELKLPASLEAMETRATPQGESIHALARNVSAEILTTGRYGVLVDPPADGTIRDPARIVGYAAESIRNWDEITDAEGNKRLSFVLLDESRHVRTGYTWERRKSYRVLELDEGGFYSTWSVSETNNGQEIGGPGEAYRPELAGKPLDRIPFVFANPTDLSTTPDRPPLLSLARLALAIYRGEADYRQALFLQGQDTLVVVGAMFEDPDPGEDGEAPPIRMGAGAAIHLKEGGSATFQGVDSQGIPEQRKSLENDYTRAAEQGSQLLRVQGGNAESGEALRIRLAAQTATIATIASSSASAVETALEIAAEWGGQSTDEVELTPNLDFSEDELLSSAQAIVAITKAQMQGAPISGASVHRLMRETDLTVETLEDELIQIAKEEAERDPEPVPDPDPGPLPGE